MFANCQLFGMDICFPDVCKTPTPAGPVPIPYPNFALGPTGVPFAVKVLVFGAPGHTKQTKINIPLSFGDEPGVLGGIKSNVIKGTSEFKLWSVTVKFMKQNATKMLLPTTQNSGNMIGCRLVPSQPKVMILT